MSQIFLCIELAHGLGDNGWLLIQPMLAGLDPGIGWESLELLGEKVLPALL